MRFAMQALRWATYLAGIILGPVIAATKRNINAHEIAIPGVFLPNNPPPLSRVPAPRQTIPYLNLRQIPPAAQSAAFSVPIDKQSFKPVSSNLVNGAVSSSFVAASFCRLFLRVHWRPFAVQTVRTTTDSYGHPRPADTLARTFVRTIHSSPAATATYIRTTCPDFVRIVRTVPALT